MGKKKRNFKYLNRELSWIKFNNRVLDEAKDSKLPISERIKFLSIASSNFDEFFMVRVASLKDMINVGYKKRDISGMAPSEQIVSINRLVHSIVTSQYNIYENSIRKEMGLNKYNFVKSIKQLSDSDMKYISKYFKDTIFPVLTPIILNNSSTFPLVKNKAIHIIIKIKNKKSKKEEFAIVQIPTNLPRLVVIPNDKDKPSVILLEEVVSEFIGKLFKSYDILEMSKFRITRNAGLNIDEDDASDLLNKIKKKLDEREWGEVIRLEILKNTNKSIFKFLKNKFNVNKNNIYEINGPLDLTFLMEVYDLIKDIDDKKQKDYIPKVYDELESNNLFNVISSKDVFLHHPYESYKPIIDFIKQASEDPNVLAIKQTLYRVSSNSPIIESLRKAAENGKEVTVLVELKARFDENNNIEWAKVLEKAGCHVIYGIPNLKIHSKICLVIRKENDKLKYYTHLGTGNYNEKTAKIYTDMSLFTSNEDIGKDAITLFNFLSGNSKPSKWNKLIVAPDNLKDEFIKLINTEAEIAKEGKNARIMAKMNSLCDKDIIDALYNASKSGVKIDLIVRGICSLKPGVKDLSENIRVKSVVGKYLEHTRIYWFSNNYQPKIYCSSADWMPRNLERRVEILFPILDKDIRFKITDILDDFWKYEYKSYNMNSDGKYIRVTNSTKENKIHIQKYLEE